MVIKRSSVAACALAAMVLPAPAQDFLTPFLESHRNSNLLKHQQEMRRRASERQAPAPQRHAPSPQRGTNAQMQAEAQKLMQEHKRKLRPEYEARVRRDGKPAADRWLRAAAEKAGVEVGRQMLRKYGPPG